MGPEHRPAARLAGTISRLVDSTMACGPHSKTLKKAAGQASIP